MEDKVIRTPYGWFAVKLKEDRAVVLDDTPEMWELIRTRKIYIASNGKKDYPVCWSGGRKVHLSRIIANPPENMVVHHRNGLPLDCSRSNLIIKTRRKTLDDAKRVRTPVKGIYFRKDGYVASWIDRDGRRRYKLFKFSMYNESGAYTLAKKHIAARVTTPIYGYYYLDPPAKT